MANLVVSLTPSPSHDELRMESFARWMGVSIERAPLEEFRNQWPNDSDCSMAANHHFAMDADRLDSQGEVLDLKSMILEHGANLLLFHCQGTARQASLLHSLTNGCIAGIRPPEPVNGPVTLEPAISSLSPLLAGLSFTPKKTVPLASFVLSETNNEIDVLISVARRPLLIRIRCGTGSIFCSTVPLPDLSVTLSPDNSLENHSLSVLPPLLFLRSSFAEQCWHPGASTAQLVLDDPYLVHRYGYVDFDQLLDSMQRTHYATSLAFIPWNCWRTKQSAVRRWLAPSSRLSLCVHGCDHTRREFADPDSEYLYDKALRSLKRMQKQKADRGASFDPVMVFPQGFFSSAALVALRQAGYLAAVNTSILAADSEADALTLGDALLPARMHPSGFPIFQRHAPRQLFDFAFALYLGKPALAVQHPLDFRNGYAHVEELFTALQKRVPELTWHPLSEQFTRCHLQKTLECGTQAMRFFTRKFLFARNNSGSDRVRLYKSEPNRDIIDHVLLNGKPVDFDFDGNDLCLEIPIDDDSVYTVEIVDRQHPHPLPRRDGSLYAGRVLARRVLSEFRDRVLCKNERFYGMAQKAVRKAELTANP